MPRTPRLGVLVALAIALAGCTQPEESDPPAGNGEDGDALLEWRDHEYLGAILADADGRSLYVFIDDPPGESACVDGCADAWPPLVVDDANVTRGEVADERVTTLQRPDGTRQLALDARPLYRFAGDDAPGDANGQGVDGKWFVVRESDAPGQLNVDYLDGPGAHDAVAENVTYAPDAEGYLARPADDGAYPGVVMIHEWWGLNDEIRTMARALATHGYAVLAVDLFNGSVASTPEDARAQVGALDQDAATANMRAAAQHLRDEAGVPGVSSLGWCFGGGQSLELALSGEPLDATVIYYGQLVTDEARLAAIEWPVLGVFGAEDASIPVTDVRAFQAALANVSVIADVHVYEGVGHAFANPSGDAYAPEEAMDAWQRTLEFLDAHASA